MTAFEQAIIFAVRAHEGQRRRGESTPYIIHPMEVAAICASMTSDEDVLAAAVLHDTVEDTNATLEQIEAQFGARVARLVAAETENKRANLPPAETWRIRKQESLDAKVEALIAERQAARKAKDFARADQIRNQLTEMGIILKDTREGVKWQRA